MSSFYFNNFNSRGEQNLIEDLVTESIRIYGVDNYYVPRKILSTNSTFREQGATEFGEALSIEMYIRNIDGFQGEGEFLSAFGVEVREQITFSVAKRTFNTDVGAYMDRDRPLEGDLIFFPFSKAVYSIKYVNVKPVFFQMGSIQFYDLICELFEYSNEVFNTGIPDIDNTYNVMTISETEYYLRTETGDIMTDENGDPLLEEQYQLDKLDPGAQNDSFASSGLDFLDFTEQDPFSEFGAKV